MEAEVLKNEINIIRNRASKSRVYAWTSMALIIFVVFSIVFFFYSKGVEFGFEEPAQSTALLTKAATAAAASPGDKELNDKLEEIKAVNEIERQKLEATKQSTQMTIFVVSLAIVRIGAVLIALYLVQLLYSVMRYQFRIADHLESSASTLELAAGNSDLLASIFPILTTSHIEFGKQPAAPMDQIIELVKQVNSKKNA